MADSKRQIKYAKQLRKDLAEIFQLDPKYYFKDTLGTITGITVSPDLGLARIYISIFPIKEAGIIMKHLEIIKPEVRNKLGRKIGSRVRIIPELAFLLDDTEEKASKIDQIINNLDIPSAGEKE